MATTYTCVIRPHGQHQDYVPVEQAGELKIGETIFIGEFEPGKRFIEGPWGHNDRNGYVEHGRQAGSSYHKILQPVGDLAVSSVTSDMLTGKLDLKTSGSTGQPKGIVFDAHRIPAERVAEYHLCVVRSAGRGLSDYVPVRSVLFVEPGEPVFCGEFHMREVEVYGPSGGSSKRLAGVPAGELESFPADEGFCRDHQMTRGG